jgi:nicotinamide mononucleotide transporter
MLAALDIRDTLRKTGSKGGSCLSWTEIAAAVLTLANIGLIVRRSVWNFPVGIFAVAIYGTVFFEARLYSDALLQVFFVVVQFYGWWKWQSAIADDGELVVRWSSPWTMAWSLALALVLMLALGTAMHRWTDAASPYLDATVAAGSVVAQFLLSFRRIENWIYWIAVNVLSVGLYLSRGLNVSAGLYALLLVMAVSGLIGWLRSPRSGRPAASTLT